MNSVEIIDAVIAATGTHNVVLSGRLHDLFEYSLSHPFNETYDDFISKFEKVVTVFGLYDRYKEVCRERVGVNTSDNDIYSICRWAEDICSGNMEQLSWVIWAFENVLLLGKSTWYFTFDLNICHVTEIKTKSELDTFLVSYQRPVSELFLNSPDKYIDALVATANIDNDNVNDNLRALFKRSINHPFNQTFSEFRKCFEQTAIAFAYGDDVWRVTFEDIVGVPPLSAWVKRGHTGFVKLAPLEEDLQVLMTWALVNVLVLGDGEHCYPFNNNMKSYLSKRHITDTEVYVKFTADFRLPISSLVQECNNSTVDLILSSCPHMGKHLGDRVLKLLNNCSSKPWNGTVFDFQEKVNAVLSTMEDKVQPLKFTWNISRKMSLEEALYTYQTTILNRFPSDMRHALSIWLVVNALTIGNGDTYFPFANDIGEDARFHSVNDVTFFLGKYGKPLPKGRECRSHTYDIEQTWKEYKNRFGIEADPDFELLRIIKASGKADDILRTLQSLIE